MVVVWLTEKENNKYKVTTIVKADGQHIKPEDYFKNYKIYDDREKQIKFTKPIEWYYPRIFSIIPYNRPVSEFKLKLLDTVQKSVLQVFVNFHDGGLDTNCVVDGCHHGDCW